MSRRPTSPHALARMAKTFPPTVVSELRAIEERLGGRSALVGLLVLAPLTPDLRYLLGLLGDPQHLRLSLADLCARANVFPGEVLKHLSAAALMAGKVQASQQIGLGIAAVAADVMRRAAPYDEPCEACQGIGTLTPEPSASQPNPSPRPCEACAGKGRVRMEPDLDRQKLAIEMAQLLPKSAGIQIGMQQNNGGSTGGGGLSGTLERLQALSDRVLYGDDGDDETVEGMVVDETPAAE